jgi:hypothetical protein
MKNFLAMTWRVRTLGALMLCSVILMGSMVGCTQAQIQQTEQVVTLVVDAASNLAAVVVPGAAWVALLPPAIAGLKEAEANFQQGTGAAVNVSNALLAVEDVISAVAPGSKASELADILTAAIDGALVAFPPANSASPSASASLVSAHEMRSYSAVPIAPFADRYNHHGRAKLAWMPFRSPAGNFKATWNRAIEKNPQLASALLK